MCGSAADYKAFQTVAPQRPVEELKEELAAIQKQYLSLPPSDFCMAKSHHRKKRTVSSCRIANGWHGETKWIPLNI
jgi:hypothetical protein